MREKRRVTKKNQSYVKKTLKLKLAALLIKGKKRWHKLSTPGRNGGHHQALTVLTSKCVVVKSAYVQQLR